MDHPNIARVLDAGETASGRPYFVMELVRGIPITQFCDENQLTPRQRLELFVCRSARRSSTPIKRESFTATSSRPTCWSRSTTAQPVPKVIDFGVAKATGQQLTEKTMFTGFGQMVGTPRYMSPEQAEMNELDIDTRSDIYSLGVLLYELLTGTTPLESSGWSQPPSTKSAASSAKKSRPTPARASSTTAARPPRRSRPAQDRAQPAQRHAFAASSTGS